MARSMSEEVGRLAAEPISRRGLVAGVGAAGMLGLAGCVSGRSEPDKAAGDRPSRQVERVIWAVDGVAGLSAIEIDKAASSPVNTPSVTDKGRLRVTSDTHSTNGNHRQAWLIPGTEGFADGEVRAVWWPPSVMDTAEATPQMGLVARLTSTGGLVADQNITAGTYYVTVLASWSWSEGGTGHASRRGTSDSGIDFPADRVPLVGAVSRLAGSPGRNVYLVDRTYEFVPGDQVAVTGCIDETFNGSFNVVDVDEQANALYPWPAIVCADNARADNARADNARAHAVPVTMTVGRMARPGSTTRIDPRSIYPVHVALRVIGSLVTAKRWRVGDVEPTWDDAGWAVTINTKHDNVQPAESGGVGVMTNHLRNGSWVEFGDIDIIHY